MTRNPITRALLLGLALCAPGAALKAAAQVPSAPDRPLFVANGMSAAVHVDAPFGRLVVAQPAIADVVPTTNQSFYVRGKTLGATNILIYGPNGRLSRIIDVQVGYDAAGVQRAIADALPDEHIVATSVTGGILLSGEVSTSDVEQRALAVAERIAPKAVTSTLAVRDAQQISLDVRIVEVSRSALDALGIQLSADSGGGIVFSGGGVLGGGGTPAGTLTLTPRLGVGSLTMQLQALETKGAARTLAKPTLTALSGQDASFLAGGEIPIPVPSPGANGAVTVGIEYHQFGVQLNFTPTYYPNGLIRLKVAPQVSALDQADGATIAGFHVPAFTVRKATTTVELRDGQSFAIAGMFQRAYNYSLSLVPGLGQVPVLGALFR
jgi:pilus assembly protein CpaC